MRGVFHVISWAWQTYDINTSCEPIIVISILVFEQRMSYMLIIDHKEIKKGISYCDTHTKADLLVTQGEIVNHGQIGMRSSARQ